MLDAGRHLASGANKKAVRALAGQWGVRQKVGGVNRGTTDILNEVQDNMRKETMRLLQEGVGEEDGGAVSREACAAESTTEACSGRSSSEKLAVSAGKRAAVVECTPGESEIARHGKKTGFWRERLKMRMCQKRKTMCLCRYKRRQWSRPSRFWTHCQLESARTSFAIFSCSGELVLQLSKGSELTFGR